MADVTFLGLGAMGAALARCAQGAGLETAVWNRTASRAEPLVTEGARHFTDAVEAVAASPIVVVCVNDYAASDAVLGSATAKKALAGRTLVQLTTGSPVQARAAHDHAKAVGVSGYLDGAIMDYPKGIGAPGCVFLVSGDARAYEAAKPLLSHLAPATTFLGEDAGLASTLDEAALSPMISAVIGAINGAALCEAGGLPVSALREMIESMMPVFLGALTGTLKKIEDDDLESTDASLATYARVFPYMIESAEHAGYSAELPKLLSGMLDRAIQGGLGEHDVSALIRVLRPDKR